MLQFCRYLVAALPALGLAGIAFALFLSKNDINYYLQTEINPGLASHGGQVSLIDVVDDGIAVLKFGGGCQGCGQADVTLREGIERTLLERIPELKGVRDVTDHTQKENAYY